MLQKELQVYLKSVACANVQVLTSIAMGHIANPGGHCRSNLLLIETGAGVKGIQSLLTIA